MDVWTAITTGFRKYAVFSGRAFRSEFWPFQIFVILALMLLGLISEIFQLFFALGATVPSMAVACRRLHDIGKSGWWQALGVVWIPATLLALYLEIGLFGFVLLVGALTVSMLFLIFLYCTKGDDGPNRFGPAPLPDDVARQER